MIDCHETTLELAGELRPCTVHYRLDEGIDVLKVVMWRTERLHYNIRGAYCPHEVRHEANITHLLTPAQIKALAAEISESLQEEMA